MNEQHTKRYLTKSRFKLARECPTKLYYTNKKKEYADNKLDDPFLEALAEGGFQVGALAKCYYPEGIDLQDYIGYDEPLRVTEEYLQRDSVTLFEAAFAHENLLIRADIVVKKGMNIDLIEVKSKSYSSEDGDFLSEKGYLAAAWDPYVYDVAFQKYVIMKAHPEWSVRSFLMLANKEAKTSVDGLNQRYVLINKNGRKVVQTNGPIESGDSIRGLLARVNTDRAVELIFENRDCAEPRECGFEEYVQKLAGFYERDERVFAEITKDCGNCEFYCSPEEAEKGLKSGFAECFQNAYGMDAAAIEEPLVFNIWNFRRKNDLLRRNIVLMRDVEEGDIFTNGEEEPGETFSIKERQWLQVERVRNNDTGTHFKRDGFVSETTGYRYPLHFIDFETSLVAIPFTKNMHPYEIVAFQFSHHTVQKDGTVEHAGEYINTERGANPNFDFVRSLRDALSNDEGTIFRWAAHENTVLCMIHKQLENSSEKDRRELCAWIRGITTSHGEVEWSGERSMVDMKELAQRYYFNPHTGGSLSIKKVLPASIMASRYLQERYGKPVYGAANGIKSMNFRDWTWIRQDGDGEFIEPYKLLPPVFEHTSQEALDIFAAGESLADGGAAMTAYAKLQFGKGTDKERDMVVSALLKYCELDTLAMVMIWKHWMELVGNISP